MANTQRAVFLLLSTVLGISLCAQDCFFYDYSQNVRTQILPESHFFKQIYRLKLDGDNVLVSLCQPMPKADFAKCPHFDSQHRYILYNKDKCIEFNKRDMIDLWKFPSIIHDDISAVQGFVHLVINTKPKDAKQDYDVRKNEFGTYIITLYYDPKKPSGITKDPLYKWPITSIMPTISLIVFLVFFVISLYCTRDNRLFVIFQLHIVLLVCFESSFQLLWPDSAHTIGWFHLAGIPGLTAFFYMTVKRDRQNVITNIFMICGAIGYLCFLSEYPQHKMRFYGMMIMAGISFVLPFLLSFFKCRKDPYRKEWLLSLTTSMFFVLILRELMAFHSFKHEPHNHNGTFFKFLSSISIGINSKVYDSKAELNRKFYIASPPVVYIFAYIRYKIVSKRIKKQLGSLIDNEDQRELNVSIDKI